MGYDSLSNLTRETLGGLATTSVYDGVGNEISLTYPGGRTLGLAYDELNRISSISDGGTTASLASYSYTGRGRVARPIRCMTTPARRRRSRRRSISTTATG